MKWNQMQGEAVALKDEGEYMVWNNDVGRSVYKGPKIECIDAEQSSMLNPCAHNVLLPRMFILGCQKCGTTSLYFDMTLGFPEETTGGHGWVTIPNKRAVVSQYADGKELHFFSLDEHYARGCSQYLDLMPPCPVQTHIPNIVIDATPNYLFTSTTPERVKSFYGAFSSKLIFVIMLRDPANRFQSYYKHAKVHFYYKHFL
jgi:hypothetical protein